MPTKNVYANGVNYLLSDTPMPTPPGMVLLSGHALWSVADGIASAAVGDPHFFGIMVGKPDDVEKEIAMQLKGKRVLVFQ